MIFDFKKHSFDKFIQTWNPNNDYVLYGASKDCVQLIESLDVILDKKIN